MKLKDGHYPQVIHTTQTIALSTNASPKILRHPLEIVSLYEAPILSSRMTSNGDYSALATDVTQYLHFKKVLFHTF